MKNLMKLLMVGLLAFAWSGCSDDDIQTDAAVDASAADGEADVVVGNKTCAEIQACAFACDSTECAQECITTGCTTATATATALFLCTQLSCFSPAIDGGADAEADAAASDGAVDGLCDVAPGSPTCLKCLQDNCKEAFDACAANTCP